ncbi:hypothetical protein Fmac_027865 [Flemingia macrophylla]|uniref:Succinate dehydrogenase subunit 4 n=1 Tax=Flemingia macrophylla TaxID=520843 RepID=A0ABD1LIX9_9FABA
MNQIRRYQRILILSLLFLSVVAPLLFVTPLGKFLSLSLSSRACLLAMSLSICLHSRLLLRFILCVSVTVVSGRREFFEDLYRAVRISIHTSLLICLVVRKEFELEEI